MSQQSSATARSERRWRLAITATIAAILLGLTGFAVFLALTPRGTPPAPAASGAAEPTVAAAVLVRPDSHRLTDVASPTVTFVEFADFECPGCAVAEPGLAQVRRDYGDRVLFAARYFPLSQHFTGERSVRAAEAAAQQGRFADMCALLYARYDDWANLKVPQDALFRSYAAELGLDLAAWDAAYADPATAARVQADVKDGLAAGVTGTPRFFLNGRMIRPQTVAELRQLLDAELTP